jgi:hypothetical protein
MQLGNTDPILTPLKTNCTAHLNSNEVKKIEAICRDVDQCHSSSDFDYFPISTTYTKTQM